MGSSAWGVGWWHFRAPRGGVAMVSLAAAGGAATIGGTSRGAGNNVGGVCVLRDAITAANTAWAVGGCGAGSASGTNIIPLPANGVITLTVADNTDPTYGPN